MGLAVMLAGGVVILLLVGFFLWALNATDPRS